MKNGMCMLLILCFALSLLSAPALAGEVEIMIPELSVAGRAVPDNEAMAFLRGMGAGWNLGNTFDAIKQGWNKNADEMTLESVWSRIVTTEEMIDTLQRAGFTSIRIPVSWHDHVDADYQISRRWLDRVQEVVDWAYSRGMRVILNTHHDEEQFLPTPAHREESLRYIRTVWQQLAERFRDYDDRLIMESMNEPRMLNHDNEWWFNADNQDCRESALVLNELNQAFVDTVRAGGGYNATRYLMVPGYDASPEGALNDSFALPKDTADNRVIVSVHAYRPYSFALELPGVATFATDAQKRDILSFMDGLYNRYIANGIPVVIGEFGALKKGDNLQDRVSWTAFYTAHAKARNLPVLWWDNNAVSESGECFGLIDRETCTVTFPPILETIMKYSAD